MTATWKERHDSSPEPTDGKYFGFIIERIGWPRRGGGSQFQTTHAPGPFRYKYGFIVGSLYILN
jgi:hypothetical protein